MLLMAIHRRQAADNIRERIQQALGLKGIIKEEITQIIEEELEDWDFFPKGTVLPHKTV